MNENDYANVMDDWQVRMIRSRARRMGFNSQDCADVAQQIAIETVAFSFDPNRANGAPPEAALAAIVQNQVHFAARRRYRYRRRIEGLKQNHRVIDTDFESKNEMELDVRTAVEQLPPDMQRVCELLSEGESIAVVAKAMGCSWHSAQRMIARIRVRFEKLELNEWLGH